MRTRISWARNWKHFGRIKLFRAGTANNASRSSLQGGATGRPAGCQVEVAEAHANQPPAWEAPDSRGHGRHLGFLPRSIPRIQHRHIFAEPDRRVAGGTSAAGRAAGAAQGRSSVRRRPLPRQLRERGAVGTRSTAPNTSAVGMSGIEQPRSQPRFVAEQEQPLRFPHRASERINGPAERPKSASGRCASRRG